MVKDNNDIFYKKSCPGNEMSTNQTRILLHTCCAPCTIYPLGRLRARWERVIGFFYNPNIHPYREHEKRLSTVRQFAETTGFEMIYRDEYDLEEFLRSVVFREQNRCSYCYHRRLEAAARTAAKSKFDAFTSTLLYSRMQKHDLIAEMGESLGRKWGVPFYYEDFREGWKEGIDLAKEMRLYRQQYCGCIYSEKERYYPSVKRGTE